MKRPKRYPTSSPRFIASWLAAGALLALVSPALVAESPRDEPASETPAPAGLRAYVDPATGELTSTPSREQVEALNKSLAQTLSRSTVGLEPFDLPRGGRGVYLERRFQSALMVKLDANGEAAPVCVDGPKHAAAGFALQDFAPVEPTLAPPPSGQVKWEEK